MIIRKACPTVFTSLEDGTAVLLNLKTLVYYSLNKTGAAIWQELESSQSAASPDLLRLIHERFEIDESAAREDLEDFIAKLTEFGVIETAAA